MTSASLGSLLSRTWPWTAPARITYRIKLEVSFKMRLGANASTGRKEQTQNRTVCG